MPSAPIFCASVVARARISVASRFEFGGGLARLGLRDRVHAHDLRLALLVDAARLRGFARLDDLDLAGAFGVGDHTHRFHRVFRLLALRRAGEPLGLGDLELAVLRGQRDLAVALRLLAGQKALDVACVRVRLPC